MSAKAEEKQEFTILYANSETGTIKACTLLAAQLAAHKIAARKKTIVISVKLI
jgi:hypothetical protein